MSNVQFEEDYDPVPTRFASPDNPNGQKSYGSLTMFLIKNNLVKDLDQSKNILIGIVLFNMSITLIILYLFVL